MSSYSTKITGAPTEFLSSEQCKAVFDRIVALGSGGGETTVSILSRYTGGATWARNRVHVTQAVTGLEINIGRVIRGASGATTTTRMDDEGLREAVRQAEALTYWQDEEPEQLQEKELPLSEPILSPVLWSDPTYAFDGTKRGELAQEMIGPAEDAGLLAAGELLISGQGHTFMSTEGVFRYYPVTDVECSMTVRNPKGTASGWAGKTHYDLARINAQILSSAALDKCVRSANPVAVEPGRYTAILEPQAVSDLFSRLIDNGTAMSRSLAERNYGPFAFKPGRSKIGQRVLDPRLTVRSDPMDPDTGFIPFLQRTGEPYSPVSWINDGYLRELAYNRPYALSTLNKPRPLPLQGSYRMSANTPPVSIEEMIATTKRGVLVTRFSNIETVHVGSMLCTGYTRDGLWLIENGKITKPIKNFRFTESPLFALNNLDSVGIPERVFHHNNAIVVPPVKVRDFSFTSLADAV